MAERPHTTLTPSGAFRESFIKTAVFTVLVVAVFSRLYFRVRDRMRQRRGVIDIEAR
jgi:hypothetical protein